MVTAVIISILNINIKYIITFNSTFFCSIFAYTIPAILHLKCAYLPMIKSPVKELTEEQTSPVDTYKESMEDVNGSIDSIGEEQVQESSLSYRMTENNCTFQG